MTIKYSAKYITHFLIILAVFFNVPGLSAQQNNEIIERHEGNKKIQLDIHFIDVLYGEATLIVTPENRNILIDTGSPRGSDILIDYLDDLNIDKIDLMIVSSPYTPYTGGASQVIENFIVEKLVDSGEAVPTQVFKNYLTKGIKNVPEFKVASGPKTLFEEGDLLLEIIKPDKRSRYVNRNSIVVKLSYKNISVLFTGAIENSTEVNIDEQEIDVLKVSNMGSSMGTSHTLLNRVHPEMAVISGGSQNPFNLPSRKVVKRLTNRNIHVERVDQSGHIILHTKGESIKWSR